MASQPIRKGNILVIDDEVEVLHALQRQLRRDYVVYIANNAEQGYAIMDENAIDVVISDQRMPDVPGNQFLARVRDHWPRTKLILLTGYSDMPAIVDAVNRAQIFFYIEKPWNIEALRTAVHNAYIASLAPGLQHASAAQKTVTQEILAGVRKLSETADGADVSGL